MADKQLLRNAFPKWFEGGGIFANMQDAPWQDEIDGVTLDIEYFGNRSGYKFAAPLVYNFLDENGAVTENGKSAIARVILARYRNPWTRLWNLLKSQYDPLDNYSVSEEVDITTHDSGKDTIHGTNKNTGTLTTDYTGNESIATTGTDNTTRQGVNTSTDTDKRTASNLSTRSGFNSPSNVNVGGQTSTGDITREHTDKPNETTTRTPDLTDTRNRNLQDKDTHDLTQENDSTTDRDSTQTEKGTRKRVGVTGISRQHLVEQEREAWQWDFFESVFSDVDKVVALSVYDPCVIDKFDYTGGGTSGGYVLPVATNANLGGVRAPAKTGAETLQVHVDNSGFLYVKETEVNIATSSKAGIVKAASKTTATVPVQVDSDGTLYVPEGGIKEVPVATSEFVGGIKLPKDPSGDGESISTKNGMQYIVDKSLSPEGGFKNDDTVSVVIPLAGTTPGLVKGPAKTTETVPVALSSDGNMWVPASGGGGSGQREVVNTGTAKAEVTLNGLAFIDGPAFQLRGNEGKTIRFEYSNYTFLLDVDKFSRDDAGDYYIGYNCRSASLLGGPASYRILVVYESATTSKYIHVIPISALYRGSNKAISGKGYIDILPVWGVRSSGFISANIGQYFISDGEYLFDDLGTVYAKAGGTPEFASLSKSVVGEKIRYSKPTA